jgi:hypothetical protein
METHRTHLMSDAYAGIYENRRAARNPESQSSDKKYDKVRGERTPMPPRGDKRREDFEKWYAKQMKEDHAEAWEEYQQLDEVAPIIAAGAGKLATMAAGKAATAGAAKAGGAVTKAASSKLGQKAISAGSQAIGNKVQSSLSKEEVELDEEQLDELNLNRMRNLHRAAEKTKADKEAAAAKKGRADKRAQVAARARDPKDGTAARMAKADLSKVPAHAREDVSYTAAYMEGYKKFPAAKVQDKAAMKPDTARGESQARKMDMVRTAATHEKTKSDAKAGVKEREQANKKKGLEKRYNAPSAANAKQVSDVRKTSKMEAVAALVDAGIADNETSAGIIYEHMSDAWYNYVFAEQTED